ncbi:MAG: hypothetical protein IJG06_04740, partial [Clostridia bacterium]|nr:hypothetical protein [Clostridia bacterium]
MKSILKKIISSTLAVSMLLPAIAAVSAAAEHDPSQDIALSTPDTLKEGNYFFIRERNFQMSESSKDNVYIPIQRTGDLSSESEVTVKLVDMTARIDENYTAKIYGENGTTEDEYGGDSLIDAILEDPDAIEEAYDTGDDISLDGAMMTDANENPIGVVKSYDSANGQLQLQSFDELEEKREENLNYPDNSLRDARNHFIGEVSDRAPIETNGQWTDPINNQMNPFTETQSEAQLAAEEYPGHTFKVHFDANEAAKYLVLTPKYSSKADGDCILMVMLKDPTNDVLLHDDFSISNVNIEDVDDKQEVKVNITNSEIRAEDGKAVVEVTREGRINELVTVRMSTSELSAETGYDFSGVDAKIHFPMGITKREIEIPVLNAEQEKDFKVIITPFTDCTVENSTAHITIAQSKELGDAELQAAGYPTDEPLDLSN